ncbi:MULTISPECIES: cytochrome P450 [Comamonadaceae]|uniref:cytochrome P450 n=1 Tax=Comamonadaceae TaxID=80864 RepID=UPI000B3FD950|nr:MULTISPECIES: cytochrome P450 [Comamonadaceae]QJY33871.1 cytochrome P450 [Diaphorobacter sp. JS3050]
MAQGHLAPGPDQGYDLDANDETLPVLQQLRSRYGPICRVPSLTRPGDGLVIHDPDDIRRVLLTNRGNYVKGAGLERVRVLLGNGLIVSDGDLWVRQRRMIQPAFQGQATRGFAPVVRQVNADLLTRWSAHADSGEPIDLTHELSSVALEIVLRALFSADFDRLVETEGGSPFDLLTEESRRDLQFAARFRGLARFVRAIIETRRLEARVESDWLSMLMQARDKASGEPMPDRALLDEVMTLIVAGHETTASTLNWTWYLLARHPEAEAALHAAIANAAPTEAAPDQALATPFASADYVEQVLQEALRLYPPVWLFSRRAVQDDTLGGYHVPAGTDIFICPYLLHRDPAQWERPEAFHPARFMPDAAAGRHRFAYLPFSAGPRFCVGAGFAMAEMATHLTMVAERFRLVPVGTEPAEAEFQINLRTRHPLRMRLVSRR